MNSSDSDLRDRASREWALWESTHISIGTGRTGLDARWEDNRFRHAFVRLTTHYWSHDGFCQPPLIERAGILRDTPGILIHGRRDVSGPAITPWLLHRNWPGSTLVIDESEGHGGINMNTRWRAANDELVDR